MFLSYKINLCAIHRVLNETVPHSLKKIDRRGFILVIKKLIIILRLFEIIRKVKMTVPMTSQR